jgi:RNA polymerase sigma factor (TIGR02999 family)
MTAPRPVRVLRERLHLLAIARTAARPASRLRMKRAQAGVAMLQRMSGAADDSAEPASALPQQGVPVVPESARALFPVMYAELRRLARSRLSSGGRHTLLDTSSLVHEAFLRMQRDGAASLNDREHFMAYAATTMRSIIIDFVRRRSAERRGGGAEHVTLDTRAASELGGSDDEILAVHEALQSLGAVDARLVQVVEMRYFAGLTDVEIGAALGVTDRTVRRDWERARLLLAEMLGR